MIPEIRLLAAKASKENDNLWLPLLDHLKDTAGVIEYLASRWLPGDPWCAPTIAATDSGYPIARRRTAPACACLISICVLFKFVSIPADS